MIVKLAESQINTKFGLFKEFLYHDGQRESHAIVMGDVEEEEEVLCRIHSLCIYGHYFNSIECDCREQMEISQQLIQKAGKGIVIWLNQEGKGNGHFALMKSAEFKRAGVPQAEAYEKAGFQKDARDFTVAGEILNDLQVKSIKMLTDNPSKVTTLTVNGIEVVGIQSTSL
ncbi:MAG: GTP cyclohydrolase [Flavobacteriaceae bacterium]